MATVTEQRDCECKQKTAAMRSQAFLHARQQQLAPPVRDLTFRADHVELDTQYVRLIYRDDRVEIFYLRRSELFDAGPRIIAVESVCVKFSDAPEAKDCWDGVGWSLPAVLDVVTNAAEIARALRDLMADGLIEQGTDGRYELTPAGLVKAEEQVITGGLS